MRFVPAALALTMLALASRPARAADQTLLLDMQVNGFPLHKIGEFVQRDGALFARPAELDSLGFRLPTPPSPAPDGLIPLSDLPGVTWRLDLPHQALYATASSDRLMPALLQVGGPSGGGGTIESGTGATFNYDVSGTSANRETVGTGLFDLRAFSPWGVADTGVLAYAGGGPSGPGTNSAVRLDSTYTYSDPDTLRRYRLGDFINGGLAWTRPVRLGGLQVFSDFSMRPDLVTFPLPSVSGTVAVPSTLDVMVNGTRLFSRQIGAGPFEIPQLPVVTGAGTVSMTVTNALGRQELVTLPFYASSTLLAPGLQTYSAQFGAVRSSYALLSNDYGALAGSATYRRGVSSDVTVEASAEGSAGTVMAGAGIVVNVGDLAVLNAAAAGSTGGRETGKQFSLGLRRTGRVYSVGASATVADHDFRDIAAAYGDPVPRLQLNANAGVSLGKFGSVGVAYTAVDRDAKPDPIKLYVPPGTLLADARGLVGGINYLQPAQHAHVLSASYSVQVLDMSFYATGFRDFANRNSAGVLVGLTIPLGTRNSVGVSAGSGSGGRYAQIQAQQSAPTIGDFGYQVYGAAANPNHEFAQGQYRSPWALLTAGVDRMGRQTTPRLEAQGALSYIDGGLFASNAIDDSFAVVDTNGLANVHVMYENRDAGTTDSSGQRLVPDLRSFDDNHIAIQPTDIPPDTTIDVSTRNVRPQDRSGVVVRFPVKVSRGALLRLVDEAGAAMPIGSTATLKSSGAIVPVGYDGEAYVEDLQPHNELAVERPDGKRCRLAFDYRPIPGEIPTIGPLQCKVSKP